MPKQIIIAEQHRIAAVFSEDRIQELVVATGTHQVSDIYVGMVENVIPGIDAAFVNIGDPDRNGFMHVTDLGPLRLKRSAGAIVELLTPQQKVLVQVMKEPTGNKGPRLTGNITLPGRYLVLMPFGRGVHLSRRIVREAERNHLRALAILLKPAGMGLLVRTEAEGVSEEAIIEDLEALQKQWEQVQEEYNTTNAPSLLNRDDDFIQRVLRDMYSTDVNRIVVDSSAGLKRIKQQLASWNDGKQPSVSLDHHRESRPILEYFRVNAAIREALKPRVDLPSGGYIIIEPTEALTVIDVNSGSFTRSATSRETVLWTNCEAAVEIARQLRLRNVAGVIVIDFIDMDLRRDQLQVLEHFNTALAADKSRPQIAQLSELGLVELTRKRQGQNIYELFSESCPTCGGLGHVGHLPGEDVTRINEAVRTISVEPGRSSSSSSSSSSSTSSSSSSSSSSTATLRNGEIPAPKLRGRAHPRLDPTPDPAADLEGDNGDAPEIDLIHHPSYQEMNDGSPRRRRRRRFPSPDVKAHAEDNAKTSRRRSEPVEEEPESVPEEEPTPTESREERSEPESSPDRRDTREKSGRSRASSESKSEPSVEEVAVEMTPEEQEVYALMGISPLIKLDRLPKAKSVSVAVVEPGQADSNGSSTDDSPRSESNGAADRAENSDSPSDSRDRESNGKSVAVATSDSSSSSSSSKSRSRSGGTRRRRRRSSARSNN